MPMDAYTCKALFSLASALLLLGRRLWLTGRLERRSAHIAGLDANGKPIPRETSRPTRSHWRLEWPGQLGSSLSPVRRGCTAIVTGGATGIGFELAKIYSAFGMNVIIGDNDQKALDALPDVMLGLRVNVADVKSLARFAQDVTMYCKDLPITIVHANATLEAPRTPTTVGWKTIADSNLRGTMNIVQSFLPLIDRHLSSWIISTGSKAAFDPRPELGISYNVSQTAIRTYMEQLAYELRGDRECKTSVHLLIPGLAQQSGYDASFLAPVEGSFARDSAEFALREIDEGQFYVVCPDQGTSTMLNTTNMLWTLNDALQGRPALSKWHDEYQRRYARFVRSRRRR